MKFYVCAHCGNIIAYMKKTGVPIMCCGEKMQELVPGTSDGAAEKHLPVVKTNGSTITVEVGSVEHPMVEKHWIEWIVLETENGFQKVDINPGQAPCAQFVLAQGDKVVSAYAYCNLHGLWKA